MPLLHGRMQHFLQEKFNAKRRCGNLGGSHDSPPGECYARCGHDRFQSPVSWTLCARDPGTAFVCYFNTGRALTACTGRLLG